SVEASVSMWLTIAPPKTQAHAHWAYTADVEIMRDHPITRHIRWIVGIVPRTVIGLRHQKAADVHSVSIYHALHHQRILGQLRQKMMRRLREEIDTKVKFERTLFDMRRRANSAGRGPSDELMTGRVPSGK
ncbi:MAG: hypothetical protein Q9207_006842, partial [Kuettlingeria erythrocarpa]